MARWSSILRLSVVFCVLVVAGGAFFFVWQVPRLLVGQLEGLTRRKVTVASVLPFFPDGFTVNHLQVGNSFSVEQARIRLDWPALLSGRFVIASAELDHPVFVFDRDEVVSAENSLPEKAPKTSSSAQVSHGVKGPSEVLIKKMHVRGGRLRLQDASSHEVWQLEAVQADVTDFAPGGAPRRTQVQGTAVFPKDSGAFPGQSFSTEGWVNWPARAMNMSLRVVSDKGEPDLESTLVSQADGLHVSGHVRLGAVSGRLASGKRKKDALNDILGALASADVTFSFITSMDQLDISQLVHGGAVSNLQLKSGK